MRDEDRIFLTMEERLERSAGSLAASPEAAAKLVERFSRLPAFQVFCGKPDVDAMYGLTGEFWDHPAVDMGSYYGFSHSFRLAVEHDNHFFRPASLGIPMAKKQDPYKPVWGVRMNNAIVLLGLMLLAVTGLPFLLFPACLLLYGAVLLLSFTGRARKAWEEYRQGNTPEL